MNSSSGIKSGKLTSYFLRSGLPNDNISVIIMRKLAAIRHRKGLSQRELARLSGITQVTIARIESGVFDPRLSTLRALAKAMKVQARDLID